MRAYLLIASVVCLAGCEERRPLPKDRYLEIAKRCGFTAVTYTSRKSFWKEEPLIDFSRERDPPKAMSCFHDTNVAIMQERIKEAEPSESELDVTFIWETRG